MSEDVPVTLKAIAAADGVNASITVGAPINKTYTGVIAGSQVVIVIPAIDVVHATVMSYTSTAEGSIKTVSGNFIIDEDVPSLTSLILDGETHTFAFSGGQDGYRYDLEFDGTDTTASVLHPVNSITRSGLPTDGGTYMVRIYYWPDGDTSNIQHVEFTVTAATVTGSVVKQVVLPATGTTPITDAIWETMTGNDHHAPAYTGDENLLSIVQEDGSQWLKMVHPAGQATDLTGAIIIPTANTYTASTVVKFANNWEPGAGSNDSGKLLFGFSGGNTPHSSGAFNVPVSGGSTATTGWSIRGGFDDDQLIIYAYYTNRPGMNYPGTPPSTLFGEFIYLNTTITPGSTYSVKIKPILNTPGNTDGSLVVTVNGSVVLNKTGMIYMEGTPIFDRWFWASNHGGGGASWAPSADTHALYRDIKLLSA